MMKRFLLVLFLFQTTLVFSQGVSSNIGSRTVGMGGTGVCLSDIWSTQNNQAGLAFLEKPEAGIYYENRFLTGSIQQQGVSFAYPIKENGCFAIMYEQFGNSLYNEKKVGLAYAMKLGKKISAGIQIDYMNSFIAQGYGKASCLTFELGLQAYITDEIILGAHVFNPQQAKYEKSLAEQIPAIFDFGLAYHPDNFLITAEIEKNIQLDYLFRIGTEYTINDKFFIRAGFSTYQTSYSMGFGMKINQLKINFSSTLHQQLGYSPQADIIYQF